MTTRNERWTCDDFGNRCCSSCHEDHDEYGMEMVEGEHGEVCCWVHREMEEMGVSVDEPKPEDWEVPA